MKIVWIHKTKGTHYHNHDCLMVDNEYDLVSFNTIAQRRTKGLIRPNSQFEPCPECFGLRKPKPLDSSNYTQIWNPLPKKWVLIYKPLGKIVKHSKNKFPYIKEVLYF